MILLALAIGLQRGKRYGCFLRHNGLAMNWHKLFFEFGGRIRRREFWAGTAILIAVQLVVLMPLADAYGVDLSKQPQPVLFRNIVLFVDIALAWPTMAVFAKRQ
ncbi:MAG: hypothetical protein AB7J19_18440, partial [Beijerinckiaceae bacterium]